MISINIEPDPNQSFSIDFEGDPIDIELAFRQENWFMNLTYNNKTVNGLRLACGVEILKGKNYPFEVFINDNGLGFDPMALDSFSSKDFEFYILEREDMEQIRGYKIYG